MNQGQSGCEIISGLHSQYYRWMEMGDRVFICYDREDEEFVLKLAASLKNRGVPVWLDQWDIPSEAD